MRKMDDKWIEKKAKEKMPFIQTVEDSVGGISQFVDNAGSSVNDAIDKAGKTFKGE